MSFKGKNIIVTGATGDLGTAITQRLISQGANVLAVGSRAGGFPRLVAACSGPGLLETIVADVSDSKQRSEEHTSELQSRLHLVCRLLLEKKKNKIVS